MSRRPRIDVVVVGGGVVGSACALALAQQELRVALVEAQPPPRWSPQQRDLRVYAFAPDNAALLGSLGVWQSVRDKRAQPYRRMQVWDAAGGGDMTFDADALGRDQLGWIVENGLLADQLWQALPAAGVEVHCPARVETFEQEASGVRIGLDDGLRINARLAVAADGAESSLRKLLGVGTDLHSYGQRGVVGYVSCEKSHAGTAWQRFLPGGPLALLPFAYGDCSIVWTLSDAEAGRVLALDDAAFAREVTIASGGRLGALAPTSPRAAFPLRRQLAGTFVQGRALLVGDAAHVVHPLAGQGVNLGLRDVSALMQVVQQARARRTDFFSAPRLKRWARQQRSESVVAAHAFDALNRLYSNDALPATLLRGHLLGLVNRAPPLANLFWSRAAGL